MLERGVTSATTYGLLLRRLGLGLLACSGARLAFLVVHRHLFADAPALDLASALVHGVRFDLSALVYLNLPLVLLAMAPTRIAATRWYGPTTAAYFVAANGGALLLMAFDIGFFPFSGSRLSANAAVFLHDLPRQAAQLGVAYFGLVALACSTVVALAMINPRPRQIFAPRGLRWGASAVLALVLSVVAARGGVQARPINSITAFQQGDHDLGVLALNPVFTLLQSKSDAQLAPQVFFASEQTVDSLLASEYAVLVPSRDGRPRPNVVLLVLESFGTEYWGADERQHPELTPFLDSLRGTGAFFANGFANGRFSMDALPALLLGVPRLGAHNIALGEYQANEWIGLGHRLAAKGYHTAFFHGAPKGTMYFDALAGVAGIEDFYPMERFPDEAQAQFDGHWGIFDAAALQFAVQRVGEFQEPWFSVMFTISAHNPYVLPEGYADSLPAGSLPIHRNIAYTDLAVRRFFDAARRQPWFEHTLFIVTGDHTAPMRSPRYDTPLGRFLVPVLLLEPGGRLPVLDTTRVVQHVDLFRTVLDWTGDHWEDAPPFGRSLFAEDEDGEAIVRDDGDYWMVNREYAILRDADGHEGWLPYRGAQTGFETLDRDEVHVTSDSVALSMRLRAQLQHFTTALVNNSLYDDRGLGVAPAASRAGVPTSAMPLARTP